MAHKTASPPSHLRSIRAERSLRLKSCSGRQKCSNMRQYRLISGPRRHSPPARIYAQVHICVTANSSEEKLSVTKDRRRRNKPEIRNSFDKMGGTDSVGFVAWTDGDGRLPLNALSSSANPRDRCCRPF